MEPAITRMQPADLATAEPDLAETLHACVHAGASVGFILPFSIAEAASFWSDKVFPAVGSGAVSLFVASIDGRIVGTVQLGADMMPNQVHRADVAKMLVHPDFRRHGIARQLMRALEAHAKAGDKSLLVLDTRTGDPAHSLYLDLGFRIAGEIPGYCRSPVRDVLEPTTYMYKALT